MHPFYPDQNLSARPLTARIERLVRNLLYSARPRLFFVHKNPYLGCKCPFLSTLILVQFVTTEYTLRLFDCAEMFPSTISFSAQILGLTRGLNRRDADGTPGSYRWKSAPLLFCSLEATDSVVVVVVVVVDDGDDDKDRSVVDDVVSVVVVEAGSSVDV